MTRVRKSYSFDKMFAVIFLISLLSLLLVGMIQRMGKKMMPWAKKEKNE
jgi:ABC-type nitrate/sulfonate/bicarbonate transport system permease component